MSRLRMLELLLLVMVGLPPLSMRPRLGDACDIVVIAIAVAVCEDDGAVAATDNMC